MNCADGSNYRPRSSDVRPLRTSSTIRRRNSGEYGRWLFGIVDLPTALSSAESTNDSVSPPVPAVRLQRRFRVIAIVSWTSKTWDRPTVFSTTGSRPRI